LLLTLGFDDFRLANPFGFEDIRTLGTFSFHLRVHGGHQLGRWANIANLNTGHFDAPRIRGLIDNMQQAGIDAVTL